MSVPSSGEPTTLANMQPATKAVLNYRDCLLFKCNIVPFLMLVAKKLNILAIFLQRLPVFAF